MRSDFMQTDVRNHFNNLSRIHAWHSACTKVSARGAKAMFERLGSSRMFQIQFFILLVVLLLLPILVHAEDTYNFYFQKAPGPSVVNQGTRGHTDSIGAELKTDQGVGTSVATSTANSGSEDPNFLKWSLGLNYGHIQAFTKYSSIGIDFGYALNEYVAFGLGFLVERPIANSDFKYSRQDWYVRMGVTPFHLSMFGHNLLDIGAVVGLMNTYKETYFYYGPGLEKTTEPFFGPAVDVHFSRAVSLRGEFHYNGKETSQALAGLKVRF